MLFFLSLALSQRLGSSHSLWVSCSLLLSLHCVILVSLLCSVPYFLWRKTQRSHLCLKWIFWKILDTIFFLLYRSLFKNLLMLRDKGILGWCPGAWRLLSLGWYFLCFWGSDTRLALNEQSRCRGDVLFPSRYSKTPRSPVDPVPPGWPFLKGLRFLLFPNIPYFLFKAKFPHIPVYLLPFVMYLHLVVRFFFAIFWTI